VALSLEIFLSVLVGAIIGERVLRDKGKTPPGRTPARELRPAPLQIAPFCSNLMAFEAAIAIAGWLPGAV
jgi:hypothetical protein